MYTRIHTCAISVEDKSGDINLVQLNYAWYNTTLQSDYIKLLRTTLNYSSSMPPPILPLTVSALKTEKTGHPLLLDATDDQVPFTRVSNAIAPRVSKAKGLNKNGMRVWIVEVSATNVAEA